MGHAIGRTARRLARLIAPRRRQACALVVQIANGEVLRASLGPALLERIMATVSARLCAALGVRLDARPPGQTEITGSMRIPPGAELAGLLARLRSVCRAGIELGEVRVTPVIHAAIVTAPPGAAPVTALVARGRAVLAGCHPLALAGEIRVVEWGPGAADRDARPGAARGEVELLFQPQLCCDTGAVVGMRVRTWFQDPDMGRLPFDEIRPHLDDTALATARGEVLRRAMGVLAGWDREGASVPFLSFDLSDRELADRMQVDAILWELDRLDLTPDRIEIVIAEPPGRDGGRLPVSANLQRLVSAGCRLAVGGFGSGAVGLEDLRRFGARRIILGPAFTGGIDCRADQQRMILAILALAEHLHLSTLAEGVALPGERAFLTQIGLGALQGDAVARALDAKEVSGFLARNARELALLPAVRRRA